MAAVMYVMISLFLPSSRRMIFGVDKRTGAVRLVRNHVTFLPPHQFYRLDFEQRDGAAQRDGLVQIQSKERVPVTISYRLRFSIPQDRLPDARRMVTDGWNAWIRARVAEAVSAVTQQVPIEELVSPTSQFTARRHVLREVVSRHLAQSGLRVTAFEIARIEPDRDALLEYKRQELRRNARGVAGRIVLIALDGADWNLLSELSFDGRIPNIRNLIQSGVTANLQTVQPTVSPMVWTSVATGLPADRHGVFEFLDSQGGQPVTASTRRSPALWEIAEAFGRRAAVVNWWAAWPPRSEGAITFDSPVLLTRNAVHPPAVAQQISRASVPLETVQYPQVRRFLNITQAEYDQSVAGGGPSDPVNIFRNVLAKTWTDHRSALSIYEQNQPLLTMVSYDGTDAVNHLFAPYHPPYREGIPRESFRRYWPAVANYYSEVDRLVGEWTRAASDDTTIILMSAYGFDWGSGRPRTPPAGRSALADHRNPGVFIAHGNRVAPSRASHTISLYDVAPTVLSVLGLPASSEMTGQHAPWIFRDVTPVTSVRVVSYDEFFARVPGRGAGIDVQQYRTRLQAVGHMIDPRARPRPAAGDQPSALAAVPLDPVRWGAYAHHNNAGIELQKQGKHREAVEAFQRAIDLNPARPVPYLNMAMTLLQRQYYTAAENVFLQSVRHGLPNAEKWFVDFAAAYRSQNMTTRAIQLLQKGKSLYPESYLIAANLGSALGQASRYTEGVPELERALGMRPTSTLALNNLGVFYARRKDYARALDFWNRSLSIDPRQPKIREAAEAARTHL
jgi:predicted AlkP superfamily phosphohydrolase/phosphomutase/Flp pilus assembly protein TadD